MTSIIFKNILISSLVSSLNSALLNKPSHKITKHKNSKKHKIQKQ
jgi:hypothetical protein